MFRGKVVKGMSAALKSMQPEKISAVLDKFEQQFEDLDVRFCKSTARLFSFVAAD